MIVLKLTGGLGNQMFQYAFGRSLQILYDDKIYLDCSAYETYKIRNYSLSNLNISSDVKSIDEVELNNRQKMLISYSTKVYHVFQKLIRISKHSDLIGEEIYRYLSKIGLYYNFDRYFYETIKCNKQLKCVYGYYQSEQYFLNCIDNIQNELKVKTLITKKENEMLTKIMNCQAIGVSIREGDDYKGTHLDVCSQKFYYSGMDLIAGKVNDPVFFIFSDCIDKVKANYDFQYPVIYIEKFKDYEGLRLLYSCKHFVISNSSYSWWGSYLSENIGKIVVAPNIWYKNASAKPAIYYDSMSMIEVK